MLNLIQLRSFVTALDEGSVSAAARKLNLTQPAVSQHVQQLESQLGTALLIRSRAGVRTTQRGAIVARHARQILREIQTMQDTLDADAGRITGTLKITTNILFSQTIMPSVIAEMRRCAPELKVQIVVTDALVDLERDGVDMALRAGQPCTGPGMADVLARKIAEIASYLAASPAYLNRTHRPKHPKDLGTLDYIQYREDPAQTSLPLIDQSGQETDAPVSPAFAAHAPNLMLHAMENAMGVAQVPKFYVDPLLGDGIIERVLPAYTCRPKPLYLLQTREIAESPRSQLMRDVLFSSLAATSGIALTATAAQELSQRAAVAAE